MKPLVVGVLAAAAVLGGCAGQDSPTSSTATNRQPSLAAAASAPSRSAPSPASASAAQPVASAERLVIDFMTGTSSLSDDATAKLDKAGRLYRDANPLVMTVAGHSDPSGSELGNLLLSAHRAAAVKQALVERGIPEERLQIVAFGQAPLPPGDTPGRSAVITWR